MQQTLIAAAAASASGIAAAIAFTRHGWTRWQRDRPTTDAPDWSERFNALRLGSEELWQNDTRSHLLVVALVAAIWAASELRSPATAVNRLLMPIGAAVVGRLAGRAIAGRLADRWAKPLQFLATTIAIAGVFVLITALPIGSGNDT